MLVQPNTNKFNYRNYQQQKVNKNTSFKGELGAKVLTEIAGSATKDSNAIKGILKKLGIGFLGLVSISKVKDILESVTEKEHALINTESIMKQAEIDRVMSATRALYGIKDPEINIYESVGEQIVEITSILNKNKDKLEDMQPSAPQDIQKVMKSKDETIEYNMMQFLDRVLGMSKSCNQNDLIKAIKLVKDDAGRLDVEKSTHFIAMLSFNNNTIEDITESFSKFYNETSAADNNEDIKTKRLISFKYGIAKLTKKEHEKYMSLKLEIEELKKNYKLTKKYHRKEMWQLRKSDWSCNSYLYKNQMIDLQASTKNKLSDIDRQITDKEKEIAKIAANSKTRRK